MPDSALNLFEMKPGILQTAKNFFIKQPGLAAAFLFGSQTKPNQVTDQSDIDLAVLFKHDACPGPVELIQMREDLAQTLGTDVDLVCLNDCSPIIGMQILEKGQILLTQEPRVYQDWVIRLTTDYADLKITRKSAEEALFRSLK